MYSIGTQQVVINVIKLESYTFRGAGAGPAGTAAAVPILEAKLMNLIKGRLQKF